jgi:hypothetical protein
MPFEVKPTRPGEFSSELQIFIDDGWLRRQLVSVRGTGVGEAK